MVLYQRTIHIQSYSVDKSQEPPVVHNLIILYQHTITLYNSVIQCRPIRPPVVELYMMAVKGEPNVEHYLFVFLKFISSVIPTIEYDYTTSFAL